MVEEKGKEEYLYSAFIQHLVSKRSDMDHTVLTVNYTMPAFPSVPLPPMANQYLHKFMPVISTQHLSMYWSHYHIQITQMLHEIKAILCQD